MHITLVFLYNERMYQFTLERDNIISIGSHKKADLFVPEFKEEPIFVKWTSRGIKIKTKNAYKFDTKSGIQLNTVLFLNEKTFLYFSPGLSDLPLTVKLPYDCSLVFGRDETNDVVIDLPFVTAKHFFLKREAGTVRIEDNNSANGLFLNGVRVKKAVMRSGDILSILSVNIILENGELYFKNVGKKISVNIDKNRIHNQKFSIGEDDSNLLKYKRSPRVIVKLPSDDIVLSAAPSKGGKYEKGRGMMTSFVGTGAMFGAGMLTGSFSPALMAARSASLVSPIVSIASSSKYEKKRKKSVENYESVRLEKYGAYIEDQKAKIEAVADNQREIISAENPSTGDCIDIVYNLYRNLWERIPSDHDFMKVRIGMGYENLCVNVKNPFDANSFQMEDDEVRELSEHIIEETRIVDNIPTRLDLLDSSVGFVGERGNIVRLVKNLVINLTVTHCFEEVRIIGMFDEDERKIWSSLRWLPHFSNKNKSISYVAFGRKNVHKLLENLSSVVKERLSRKTGNDKRSLPYYLFIFGSKDIAASEEITALLEHENVGSGLSAMFLYNDLSYLPRECKMIVNVDDGFYFETKNSGEKVFFTEDKGVSNEVFDSFARRMSAIYLENAASSERMPDSLTFLEGYGVKTAEKLNVLKRWNNAEPYKSLAAQIGVMSNGKVFELDIHQSAHGPHGLIGGTTGSGKSEFLRTWILSMAVNYHPYDVSFIIIDYKGGGLANFIEPLPHIVGVITNIGNNISRSLVSLKSEALKRERLLDECSKEVGYHVNDINEYQRLYHKGIIKDPLPHLIIIVDEFAELKNDRPEFMESIVSISRIGRSLGIHLVLTTQNPGTAVDEDTRNNSSFRICLKVTEGTASKQVIGTADAATINEPGRGYMHVPPDVYALFQSYWSMAPYDANLSDVDKLSKMLSVVDSDGNRIGLKSKKKDDRKEGSSEMAIIVDHIVSEANRAGIVKIQGPWLPELPRDLTAEELNVIPPEKNTIRLPIGMFDIPKKQQQGTQYIDLTSEGNYAIYGAPGTGKTTLLKTIIAAIGRYYSPDEVNVYILDFGGWSMNVFADMPHVGGVALDCEEEKFPKFIKLINDEFEERKRQFFKASVGSISSYRETTGKKMPSIIVAVDNIVPSFELYPDIEALFVRIVREGLNYGIHLIYTSNSTQGVKFKIVQSIQGVVSFELTDPSEYINTVGRMEPSNIKSLENVGRAMLKSNPVTELQIAKCMHGENDKDINEKIREFANKLLNNWDGQRPKPIPVMPEHIDRKSIQSIYRNIAVLPVGISFETTEPACIDLSENRILLVTGSMNAGKSKALEVFSLMISEKHPEGKMYVFDGKKESLSGISDIAASYCLYNDHERLKQLFEMLGCILDQRQLDIKTAKKSGIAPPEFEPIVMVIDDVCECMNTMQEEDSLVLEKISTLPKTMGIITIAAGRTVEVDKAKIFDSFVSAIVNTKCGLGIGGSPADYSSVFNIDTPYSERSIPGGAGNGFILSHDKCRKVKLIES